MKVHVLDANALFRYLTDKPGADIVNRLFRQAREAQQPLRMSIVNWGEVYYSIAKGEGFTETARIMERARVLPLIVLDANEEITTRAAQLKAGYGLPYADCFAAATAGGDAFLVTADVKDFKKVPNLRIVPLPEQKPAH